MCVETTVDRFTPEAWRDWASAFADHSLYQTWQFGERRAAETKASVARLVVRRGGAVVGMAQMRIKRVPWLRTGVAYLYHGPLWRRPGASADDLRCVLEAIRLECCRRGGLEVRVVPNVARSLAEPGVVEAFDHAGYTRDGTSPPYRTFLLDLSPSLEALRSGLAQKWRNGLNNSEKRGLTVQAGADEAAMAAFEELYSTMWERKRFETGVSVASFRALQGELAPEERQTILLAMVDGRPVAGHVCSLLGDTCIYLLGASDETGRKTKASYLLQWRTIEMAKEAGARWYDQGGIDPEGNPGVYHFKAGLNGQDCTFLGQFKAEAPGAGQYVVPLAERAYRWLTRRRAPLGAPVGPSA